MRMANVHAACIRRIVHAAQLEGMRAEQLLNKAGLSTTADLVLNAAFTESDSRHFLPVEHAFSTWDAASVLLDAPRFFPALCAAMPVEALGPLGFRALTARTLRESLECLMKGFDIVTTSGVWEARPGAGQLTIVWHRTPKSLGQSASTEALFVHTLDMLRDIAGHDLRPEAVGFQHVGFSTRAMLSNLLQARIEYGAHDNFITFSLDALEATPRVSNVAMTRYFEERVSEQLALARAPQTLIDALRRELRGGFSLSTESLCESSERLGMSERTLQRRLAEAGTTFGAELERARRERAFRLVSQTDLRVKEIAKELGFADSSTFARAFRRWFAASPGALRARRQP